MSSPPLLPDGMRSLRTFREAVNAMRGPSTRADCVRTTTEPRASPEALLVLLRECVSPFLPTGELASLPSEIKMPVISCGCSEFSDMSFGFNEKLQEARGQREREQARARTAAATPADTPVRALGLGYAGHIAHGHHLQPSNVSHGAGRNGASFVGFSVPPKCPCLLLSNPPRR